MGLGGYSKSSYPIITFSSTLSSFYYVIEKEKRREKDMGEKFETPKCSF